MNALGFIYAGDPIGTLIWALVVVLIVAVLVWAIKQFLGR
jgi:hypothetical protein